MNEILDELHDIDGLDAISKFPLSFEQWCVVLVLSVFFVLSLALIYKKIRFILSWKHDALQKLLSLENALNDQTALESAALLSEYLRRIAIRRFSRGECAGLTGEKWLQWLYQNDLKKFNWIEKGKLLLVAPYAPKNTSISSQEVKALIQAVRNWVV